MPKLWNDTIEAHRASVREATLDATSALVAEHGLLSVTMSLIAKETGIGRATLYKYFPDVESILLAVHERQIGGHLQQLAAIRDRPGSPAERLAAVLEAFAHFSDHSHVHDNELLAILHRDRSVTKGQQEVTAMIAQLIGEGAAIGEFRNDVHVDELANYCLNALAGARTLPSKAAVRRLVDLTLAGLRATERTSRS